jgi:hypothetical protein
MLFGEMIAIYCENHTEHQCSDGFEVLRVVHMKNAMFWEVTPYNLIDIHRCFGET